MCSSREGKLAANEGFFYAASFDKEKGKGSAQAALLMLF